MSKAILKIQDPHDGGSVYLLETLLERVVAARKGGGAFAWATSQGVNLLLRDVVFERFTGQYPFDLIVGVDAITTPAALEKLAEAERDLAGLSVRVFFAGSDAALFHPKFAWFEEADGGTLVVGSGNLTNGGLRQNWEAYAVTPIHTDDLQHLRSQWADWKKMHAARLFPLDAAEVVAQAELNERQWKARERAPRKAKGAELELDLDVLIAEIPKAGDRWEQANFDKASYERFFGAKVGTQRRMLFQHMPEKGELGPVESRPSVEVKSKNWRFELNAASGLRYPSNGRPIGVFLRVRQRTFVYSLVLPSKKQHSALTDFLDKNWKGRKDRMRRIMVSAAEVENLETVKGLLKVKDQAFVDEEID